MYVKKYCLKDRNKRLQMWISQIKYFIYSSWVNVLSEHSVYLTHFVCKHLNFALLF